jgi:hypothetical protein
MAKLADAADLKSAGRKAVGVQVPLWAPNKSFKIEKRVIQADLPADKSNALLRVFFKNSERSSYLDFPSFDFWFSRAKSTFALPFILAQSRGMSCALQLSAIRLRISQGIALLEASAAKSIAGFRLCNDRIPYDFPSLQGRDRARFSSPKRASCGMHRHSG